ncbi:hypothetical protein ANN_22403 [Periplaneta americana]|uniref:Reverse transcriptase domain-containing protein n=1 Tax=Periplaneta americana TaxID=6978 RepID=A0ABQ8S8D0_PERAM|nr:hypothetical protein ANN_22403 [Periplaneta americana]
METNDYEMLTLVIAKFSGKQAVTSPEEETGVTRTGIQQAQQNKTSVQANGNSGHQMGAIPKRVKELRSKSRLTTSRVPNAKYVIRKVQDNREGLELNWLHQLLVYADDVNMLEENPQTIRKNMEILLEASKAIGLEVNPEKTNGGNLGKPNQVIKSKGVIKSKVLMPRTRHRPSGFSPTAVENLRRNQTPKGDPTQARTQLRISSPASLPTELHRWLY